ncbi:MULTISPECIES: haloacid dehalogenase type II [unclassified Ensifer]|uniref:haloacid dehalogenase type II n=1 Tax=unclassified Ensifer TaxID=2633371 RepID=UPI000715E83E|nr:MULTISPECIES: haloacid dehalogenase type II [unclassified Ensifer]KQX51328.1 haloacid dehalogenase [Ensifer sp. Root1298]KQX83693.1 haloacid dehalogenase [Ensifer sp. Root1312]KRC20038.1 haloacid dehalogenase [Ensifer sp. Root74]KRD63285.1 haloacid dehalogenase [Ensifer sp. Root954]
MAQEIKAIVFDTFGTVVDWRGSIINDLGVWGEQQGLDVDWAELVDRWRDRYNPQKARVRSGELPWTNLDELHLEALKAVFEEMGLPLLDEPRMLHINKVWHRLAGWSDASSGLHRLKRKFIIGPLSNANVAILVNMAKHADLPWDNIFSCELFRHYKPDPETYLGVCKMLYLEPKAVMMCAAHNYDLAAARDQGLKTAFIYRPTEYGPGQTTDLRAEQNWDYVASDLNDLAVQLGC